MPGGTAPNLGSVQMTVLVPVPVHTASASVMVSAGSVIVTVDDEVLTVSWLATFAAA